MKFLALFNMLIDLYCAVFGRRTLGKRELGNNTIVILQVFERHHSFQSVLDLNFPNTELKNKFCQLLFINQVYF